MCKYCDFKNLGDNIIFDNGDEFAKIIKTIDGYEIQYYVQGELDHSGFVYIPIEFCPKCGRKLGELNEKNQ